MKHKHKDFPSDVFVMLQVLKANIWLGNWYWLFHKFKQAFYARP